MTLTFYISVMSHLRYLREDVSVSTDQLIIEYHKKFCDVIHRVCEFSHRDVAILSHRCDVILEIRCDAKEHLERDTMPSFFDHFKGAG